MSDSIKVRTERSGELVTVRVLLNHPMLSEQQAGARDGAHFITDLEIDHSGAVVLRADWGPGLSRNPFIAFRYRVPEPAGQLRIRWRDNRGATDELLVAL